MRVAVLSSAGKDSTYASWWAKMQGWDVVSLVTVHITGNDSMMFQIPNTALAGLQAYSMGTNWLPVLSDGTEEDEIIDLENALSGNSNSLDAFERICIDYPTVEFTSNMPIQQGKMEIDAIVVGALRSDYQKTRIDRMCERLGLISYSPLWHNPSEDYMTALIEHGFDVRIVSVSTEGMDDEWLGIRLTNETLEKLLELSSVHRFNVDGEGGEFETIVVAAPHMNDVIETDGESMWDGTRGVWNLTSARLKSIR